jgi:hypothetical protein
MEFTAASASEGTASEPAGAASATLEDVFAASRSWLLPRARAARSWLLPRARAAKSWLSSRFTLGQMSFALALIGFVLMLGSLLLSAAAYHSLSPLERAQHRDAREVAALYDVHIHDPLTIRTLPGQFVAVLSLFSNFGAFVLGAIAVFLNRGRGFGIAGLSIGAVFCFTCAMI